METFNQVKLKKDFNKGNFKTGAGLLKQTLWYLVSICVFRSGVIPFSRVLVYLLRIFGAQIGKDVRIKPGIWIKYPWKLKIGDHSWLAECYIENLDQVNIGANCCISQKAMLMTGNHDYKKSTFDLITSPIILEDGVWIGAASNICPGVTAKTHAVLTMGSTISTDMDAWGIYKGNPAIKIKTRTVGI